jgi:hypothetical protein
MKNAGYHVQTTLVWENMASLENVKDADVVREDVKNFTDIPSYCWVGLVAYQG